VNVLYVCGTVCVCRDNVDVLVRLLDKSGDADVVNFKLRSILHVAVYEQSTRSVELLLRHSASCTAQVQRLVFGTFRGMQLRFQLGLGAQAPIFQPAPVPDFFGDI